MDNLNDVYSSSVDITHIRHSSHAIMAESNNDSSSSFVDDFSCKICLEVLDDPVQCQKNEHYFCRKCITRHLKNSETCPLCADQLTLETLRPPSRIVANIVAKMKKPRCKHVSRGCKENVQIEELLTHEESCDYAPVSCLNEGCEETVNRRDKERHGIEECKFRKINCESCDEEMVYVDYEKHRCTLRREMNEVKSRLDEMNKSLKAMAATQNQVLEKLEAYDQSIKDLQNPLRHFSSATLERDSTITRGQILIFSDKSLEVFNWSTKTWTLMKDCLFFTRYNSFSFLFGKRIMVCGGNYSNRIEFLNPSENGFSSNVFPGSLPSDDLKGVLWNNYIITFGGEQFQRTSLERPWGSTVLTKGDGFSGRGDCAFQCIGNDIFIIGYLGERIEQFDMSYKRLTTLTSLPYKVYRMATVVYKDNIIIIGGQDDERLGFGYGYALNDVLMYNTPTLECKRLPSMLQSRAGHAAVIMGDVIVVMGGETTVLNARRGDWVVKELNTVECYVIGDKKWKRLPAMNEGRHSATACVYV